MLHHVKLWTYAARPKTLFIGISPILMGTMMAVKKGAFDLPTLLWTLVGTLMIQIGTNYSNDYFDFLKGADTADRKGSQKVLQKGLIKPSSMLYAFILCFLGATICTCMLAQRGGNILLFIGALCILFSILYTAPLFPLAYLGLGDLFVLVFYGPVATIFCYYLQTLRVSHEVLLASWIPGCLGVAVLTLNNLRDYEEDKKIGKKTLVVRYGIHFGKVEYLIMLLIAFFIPSLLVLYTKAHVLSLTASCSLLLLLPGIRTLWKTEDPLQIHQLFIKTARLVFVYTLLFSLGWVI